MLTILWNSLGEVEMTVDLRGLDLLLHHNVTADTVPVRSFCDSQLQKQ